MTASGIATVARQEFRLRIRAGRWRVLLGIWFAVLLGFTVLLRGALGGVSNEDVANKGVVIFGGLMVFVLGLALLVVPALAAQSVNGDRERGTLATLQVTRLSAAEIALGKFAAAWGTSLVFLALTLPLVLYAVTQHGVGALRVLTVLLVLALLLGTVSAVSLALSALLTRTTTSGVLAYLAVFALTVGTLVLFGLVTAATSEKYQETFDNQCPTLRDLPAGMSAAQKQEILASCTPGQQTQTLSRARTDRTWFLLSPNPFVVLADAAPQLPPLSAAEVVKRSAEQQRGIYRRDARDLDPLGRLGRGVRNLRLRPTSTLQQESSAASGSAADGSASGQAQPQAQPQQQPPLPKRGRRPVWPYGLAFDVALAAGALVLTTRSLRTPSRKLAKGQRIA